MELLSWRVHSPRLSTTLRMQAAITGEPINPNLRPHMYGTHYSSQAAVLHYLQR